ncbi:MAG TPA: peptidylprolyl isomerase [Coriobacteriia bacterium]
MPVRTGDTVRVHYRGSLTDGTLFDQSEGRDPLAFTVGLGQVIPGFERAVIGLEPGETVTVTIEPVDAYGPHHAELRHAVTLADFASTPYIGGEVNLVSPEGDEMPGRIVSIEGDDVTIDFNHPLAGETLVFEITLVEFDAVPEA